MIQDTTNPLLIDKDDYQTEVAPGDTITYTITYSTTADVTGVVIEEVLPDDTAYSAANDALGWTEVETGVYQLDVGELAVADGELTTTFTVIVAASPAGSTVSNTVSITDGADHIREATDTDTIAALSDLSVSVDDGNSTVEPGDPLTYVIDYENTGGTAIDNVVLTVALPAGLEFNALANPDWSLSGSTLTCDLGTVAASGSGNVDLLLTVADPAPAGLVSIVTEVTIAGDSGADTASDVDALIAAPAFNIAKTDYETEAAPGDVLVYEITFSNTGNQDAAGVVLTETLPVGTTFNSDESTAGWTEASPGVYVNSIGLLDSGGPSGTILFAVTVNDTVAAGQTNLVNMVMIEDESVFQTASDTDTLNATPDLAVGKTDNLEQVGAGQRLTYTISYSNVGEQGATGVVLTDTLPANLSFDEGDNPGWTQSDSVLTYDVPGTVAAGGGGSVTLILTVDSAAVVGDTVTNTVSIADDGANGADPNPANDTASDTDTVGGVDLAIAKTVSDTAAIAGQAITYTITVTNVGAGAAPDVLVTDVLPAGTTYVAATAPDGFAIAAPDPGYSGTVTFSAASLAGGESATFTLVVQTNPDAATTVVVANTAEVASSVNDMNSDDNTTTAAYTVVRLNGAAVCTSSVDSTLTDLVVGGSTANDVILITASSTGRIHVYMNGVSYGPFAITGRIVAYGRAGVDRIYVSSQCSLPSMLFGGSGNDLLYANSGGAVLVGGDGNDTLVGGKGSTILIGGRGSDSLHGSVGSSILIGGSSVYDSHEIALNALLNEWGSDLPYWKRVRHIYDGGDGILPTGLNGGYYFNRSTLVDDAARDLLLGGTGTDFFFAHSSGGGVYDIVFGLKNNVEWLRYY